MNKFKYLIIHVEQVQMQQNDNLDTIFGRSVDLFLRHGYEETTLRMIQKATGLHSGSIYYAVNGKEGILSYVTEAFFGDILCRSSRISRERGDRRLLALLPPAFLLHAASGSVRLSRLLSQIFRIGSQMGILTKMADDWMSRCGSASEGVSRIGLLAFFYGGIGALISSDAGYEEKLDSMLMFAPPIAGEAEPGLKQMIMECVSSENLPFIGRDVDRMDSEYGDE